MAISHCTGFSDQGLHASLCDGSDLEPRGRATSDVACCFMTLPDMQAPQIDAMHGECCLRHNLPSGFDARRQQNNGLDLPRGSNVRSSSIRHVMTPREPAILQSAAGVGSATRVARQPPVLEPRGPRQNSSDRASRTASRSCRRASRSPCGAPSGLWLACEMPHRALRLDTVSKHCSIPANERRSCGASAAVRMRVLHVCRSSFSFRF